MNIKHTLYCVEEPKILDMGGSQNPNKHATHIIDIDPTIRSGKKFESIQWNLNKIPLPYPNNYFDGVYCDNLIEHLSIDLEPLLKEVYRIMKEKSNIILICPNSRWWFHRIVYLFGYQPQDFLPSHNKHYSYEYVYSALINAGFKVHPAWNIMSFIPFINNFTSKIQFKARKV